MTMKPEDINNLAEALSKAQAEIMGAHKDSTNPHFKSKYADLESVWDACRLPLTKNKLSIIQTVHKTEGEIFLRTMLCHSTGQYIYSDIPVIMNNRNDMQALGSALTYARRYGLSSIVGVCPSDDDANLASEKQEYRKPMPIPRPPLPPIEKKEDLSPLCVQIFAEFRKIIQGNKNISDWLTKEYGSKDKIIAMNEGDQTKILTGIEGLTHETALGIINEGKE